MKERKTYKNKKVFFNVIDMIPKSSASVPNL